MNSQSDSDLLQQLLIAASILCLCTCIHVQLILIGGKFSI